MAIALMTPEHTAVLLPVVQFKESHNLELDLTLVGPAGATVVAPPYQAMSVDDTITLSVKTYFAGEYYETLTRTKKLTALDIGHPLQWTVPQADLDILLDGDHLEVSYIVVYATRTIPTDSEEQTFYIAALSTPLLPPLAIKGFQGDSLDPEAYPGGITLTIEHYDGIEVGDDVLVYAVGDTGTIKTARVDQTTIDSQKLEINLDSVWLVANIGYEVSLMYQYARLNKAGTSTAFSLKLRKKPHTPPPLVVGVQSEGEPNEHKGYLQGRNTTNGVTIDIPPDAVIGAGDKRQLVWDGHKPDGYYVADPTVGDPKRFKIPKKYIPANLGKRLPVYYEVTPPGEDAYPSVHFNLEIRDLESGWPTLQIFSPAAPNNILSLKTVTDVVTFRLSSWTFMAEGQKLRITAEGVLQAGGKERFNLREGIAEEVTDAEYDAGRIEATLSRDSLAKLKLNVKFDVNVEISFDGGESYKKFPMIDPQLVE